MSWTVEEARALLQDRWGHADFRKSQEQVIEFVAEGGNVLAVLPTSEGKSACFQIPAILHEGGTIVVSPLIALMKDQVDDCNAKGVPAVCLNSHMDDAEKWDAIEQFQCGSAKLMYVAPERINSPSFIEAMQNSDVSMVVADEAHCCSQWGHQFRPEYMHIHRLITSLRKDDVLPQVLMFTATATPLVVKDIVQSLGLKADEVTQIVADPIRANLRYITKDAGISGGYGNIWEILRSTIKRFNTREGRHIIYVSSRKGCETVASICEQVHYDGVATAYHAGMKGDDRTRVQEAFKSGKTPIVCATTAFGMGIDVPNIRTVVLMGVPGSLEDFVQQTGRAGRDGLESNTILIADDRSVDWQTRLVENESPPMLHYELAWEWLHLHLQPGGSLKMSAADMAQEITAMRKGSLEPEQVNVILNRLHAAALIERRNVDAGTPVTVDPAAWRAAADDPECKAKPAVKQVWSIMWSKVIAPALAEAREGQERLTVYVSKKALQEQAGVSGYMVGKAIEAMGVPKRLGITHIGDTFVGKSVRVLKWRASLADELPVARINEKRDNDFARLHRMVSFARLETEDERKALLRHYFLSTDEQ